MLKSTRLHSARLPSRCVIKSSPLPLGPPFSSPRSNGCWRKFLSLRILLIQSNPFVLRLITSEVYCYEPYCFNLFRKFYFILQSLYTYPDNFRAYKILIAAEYSGAKITLPPFKFGETNQTAEFLKKFPLGKVFRELH